MLGGLLYVLLSVKYRLNWPGISLVYRYIRSITPWSLIGVFMLGVLIAIVKLQDLATVIPGVALFSLMGLLLTSAATNVSLDPDKIWPEYRSNIRLDGTKTSAKEHNLVHCHSCSLLLNVSEHKHCPRCHSTLHLRKPDSLARSWALLMTAAILLIPANLYPVMTVIQFGRGSPDTIMSGVVHLIESGMWPLALLVFFASIVVPVTKLLVLTFLLISIQRKSDWRPRDRTRLFRITEVVGAWSMVDIFLVGILAALVNLDSLATIVPGVGASFFGAVVVITLFAAHSFDSRLIWDNNGRHD
jgi:paraquat-inducible protein A